MKKSEVAINLEIVYKDINSIKIDSKDSFETTLNKFYEVMRKHGICQGVWSENGRTVCNAEWIMCYAAFKQHKVLMFDVFECLNAPPDDLLAYDKE